MGDWQLTELLRSHLGTIGAALGVLVALATRFLPALLTGIRERRLAELQKQLSERNEHTDRERALFERLDRKDETLARLTTEHIQSLERHLAASQEFHSEALKLMRELVERLEDVARAGEKRGEELRQVKEDTTYLKGRLQ